jgi:hypothetical protein
MNACAKIAILGTILVTPIRLVSGAAEVPGQPPSTTTNAMILPELNPAKPAIWQDRVGNGFVSTAQNFTVEAGAARGVIIFGSRQEHDLGLLSVSYGHMLGRVIGGDHWYRGNFEGRLEVFGGMQFHPDVDTDGWLIGATPHVRYNFATGTRWIPFVDAGAGVTATGIGPPDLSGTFEFNLQAATGGCWFLRDNLALTGEVRLMHMSCGGIHSPNLGINDVAFMMGVTWFFGK